MKSATIPCSACEKLNRVDISRADQGPTCGSCGQRLRLDQPVRATERSFARIIADASVPVLVDFYADWCGPCKMMAPILDEVARARAGKALVVKLDTDDNPGPAAQYGIRGIPTLIVFEGGVEKQRQVGAVPRQVLERMI